MKQLTKEDALAVLQSTAVLECFKDQTWAKYPKGVESLRAFENISPEQFPDDSELTDVVEKLIDQQIEVLSKLGEKYAQ
jgi:hypothetical protein